MDGQFQINLQAKDMNFFDLNIHIFYSHFPSIFYRSCEIQRVEILELQLDAKNVTQMIQLLGVASTVCKKAVDLTTPAIIEEN